MPQIKRNEIDPDIVSDFGSVFIWSWLALRLDIVSVPTVLEKSYNAIAAHKLLTTVVPLYFRRHLDEIKRFDLY